MTRPTTPIPPFVLETQFMERVWGGQRMGDGRATIGEAWGAFDGNRIMGGPLDGLTLAEACLQHGAALLGAPVVECFGRKFPILTKLLDTSAWLSIQLHPNDEQAQRLEGPDLVGKTEAWHVLETAPEAEIILGLQSGVDTAEAEQAVRSGSVLDIVAYLTVAAGDTWFIPAGTIHALGPGMFLYEVQQASDITYRVYDWDRPAEEGRALHIEQSVQCLNPAAGEGRVTPEALGNGRARLVSCNYFALERLELPARGSSQLDTGGASFHALTVIAGTAQVATAGGAVEVGTFQTAIVPASSGRYEIAAEDTAVVMIAFTDPASS